MADRLSPLFDWRSAIASTNGPADCVLTAQKKDGSGEESFTVKAATLRLVALTLSLHMNKRGGSCWPGIGRIAREAGISERAVQRAIRALAHAGWLAVRSTSGGARAMTNKYSASLPADFVWDEAEEDEGVTGGHPLPFAGVTGSHPRGDGASPEDVKESVKNETLQHLMARIEATWLEHAPPLIKHPHAYFEASKCRTAMGKAMGTYSVEAIQKAIENYATVLASANHLFSWRYPAIDFFHRERKSPGIDHFVDEAGPFEKFGIRNDRPSGESFERLAELG